MSGGAGPSTTWARDTDVEWVGIDGDIVVYDPRTATLHHLNRSAATVWLACDGDTDVAGVAERARRASGGEPGEVARGVATILQELAGAALLTRGDR